MDLTAAMTVIKLSAKHTAALTRKTDSFAVLFKSSSK
jgi:hypothetical protein